MIRVFLKLIGEYKKDTILAPIFISLEVLWEILIPMVMAYMIDRGISAGDMNVVLRYGLLLIVLCLASLLSGVLSGRYAARASSGFAKNLRKEMYDKIQDFSFHNIEKFSTSGLITRMTTDVTNIQNAFQMVVRMAFRVPLMIVFSIIMAIGLSPELSWLFAGLVPLLALLIGFISAKAHPIFQKVFRMYDQLNLVVQENLRGIRVVKSYVREEQEIGKFQKISRDIYDRFVTAEKLVALNSPLMQLFMYICSLLVCWLGAQMIVGGTLTTGQMMSFLSYSIQILGSLMTLSMIFVMLIISRSSIERIYEVLVEEPEQINGKLNTLADGSIEFEDVSFSYQGQGGKLCLQDIDLKIESCQTVGIIGGTGSGKSTLIQLVPRLYDATEGVVKVGGRDVREYDMDSLREEVAIVLQKNVLFSGTIKENLRWGNKEATDEELMEACRLAQADGFIQSFPDGYDTWLEQGGANVSGGQRQRLCIARALLKQPKVLILDDSTSAVDTKTDAAIRKAFKEEIPNITKLIISQRVSSIQESDLILVLDDGRISDAGKHEDLLTSSEIYREVYLSQQKEEESGNAA
ncbi:ABC transporter ATP-binding protein [Enterococcus faecium]|uniref:ABC transporter ATP-binding protein n=1 Tax=Enterococcus faecium TaxID=1352 RepID=UPI0033900537